MENAVLHVHNVLSEPQVSEENIFKSRLYCQKRIPLLVKQQTGECKWGNDGNTECVFMSLLTVQLQFKCFTVLYTVFTLMLHSDLLFPAAGN
jgi:hypothetical protein